MSRVLLAAEAGQIQDLIFRSSKLREVTGGSEALEEFWNQIARLATEEPYLAKAVPVHAGGNLRVLFEGDDASARAHCLARDVADLYAMHGGSRLSVAVCVAGSGDGSNLWEKTIQALALRKEAGGEATAVPGFPYVEPCASCGVEPAQGVGEGDLADVCISCSSRRSGRDRFRGKFLSRLKSRSAAETGNQDVAACSCFSQDPVSTEAVDGLVDLPSEMEIGRLDRRHRVAYLLADGNGFGVHFREAARQGAERIETLSKTASTAGACALATATRRLLSMLPASRRPERKGVTSEDELVGPLSPVLPLITGGDDIFALVPAPWAFWFAQEFAGAFTQHVQALAGVDVSVSCALVICKDTFPYRFAHEAGEAALKAAKAVSRSSSGVSVVRAVELRSALADAAHGPHGQYGAFALHAAGSAVAEANGLLSTQVLTESRRTLSMVGTKRLHQLEDLFAAGELGDDGWHRRMDWLLGRVGDPASTTGSSKPTALRAALVSLAAGSGEMTCTSPLAQGSRPSAPASAAVDLLHLWDYLRDPAEPEERP